MLDRLRKIWAMSWFDITLIEIEFGNYVIELVFDEPIPDATMQSPLHVDITPVVDLPEAVVSEPNAFEQAIDSVSDAQVAQADLARTSDCLYLQEPDVVYAALADKPLVVELSKRLESVHGTDYAAPLASTLHKAFQETRWSMSFTPKPGTKGERKRFELSTHELLVVTDGMALLTPELEQHLVQRAIELAETPIPVKEEPQQKRHSRGLVRKCGRLPNSKARKKARKPICKTQGSVRIDIGQSHLIITPLG